jgi:spermidine synthase
MNARLPGIFARRVRIGWIRWCIYACFFLSGSTALVFEVLWSRQFVTLFGNSSYAISIVLCAYMAGLGLGSLIGGRLADRTTQWMNAYGAVHVGIAAWALAVPVLLARLRILVPTVPALSPDSLIVSTLARFAMSFAILVVPCFLMGTMLPLLVRAVIKSDQSIGARVGALYCWNTLGAAFGCLAAGFLMIDTLGLRLTNLVAVGVNSLIALAAFALSKPVACATDPAMTNPPSSRPNGRWPAPAPTGQDRVPTALLFVVAFLNGLASLTCEVLWFRYLAFLSTRVYVFSMILCIYLLGLGIGGLIYSLVARRIGFSARALGIVEVLLAIAVLATFAAGALVFAGGPPWPLSVASMALVTVSLPTVLMGVAFPLLSSAYGRQVQKLGRRIGLLYAVNIAGTVFGSILPMFVFVPWLGIQRSLLLVSLLYGGMGLALLTCGGSQNRRLTAGATVVYAGALLVFVAVVPSNLCQRVFLATDFNLARHSDILFYQEGRTGTGIVTRDRANDSKTVYINGVSEVPISYSHQICFKMLGDLGPMLHANPDEVLMICFGGGIAGGATTCLPDVKSLTVVDLERSVVKAASTLAKENNGLLQNPKAHVVIDDGRDYIMMARRKWPVIVSDSSHPKDADSWVLYTREFYHLVQDHLKDDGVFVEWLPRHGLHTAEFKIIVRTFLSVFPHTSLWVTHGIDAQGGFVSYTLLVATPKPLSIDVAKLRDRLNVEPVRLDLEPFGLHTPAGFLDAFLCTGDTLRQWVGAGPINTDDLPYTQYETRYSKGAFLNSTEFIEPMEDIWPCLTGTGPEEQAKQLHDELTLRARVNRLAFLGRWEEAYAVLPEDVRFRQMRRLYEEGPRYVQTLLDTYRDNPRALVHLAELRACGPGGVRGTKAIYERVLELDPENVSALNMLGAMHSDAGDVSVAESYLRTAVRLRPGFDATHFNLGLLLDRTGRHAEALQQYQQAALVSDDPRPVDQWGFCLVQEGRAKEAISWFSRAVEMQPTFVPGRLHLAAMLYRAGHRQEALPHVRYVLKMDPENKAALSMLSKMKARGALASDP